MTALFATGHLLAGTLLALAVGVLDGLDGKQARVKVETTPLGKREHALDYVLELSWWTALAFHFQSIGALPSAFLLLALLVGSDLLDRFAKKLAKEKTGAQSRRPRARSIASSASWADGAISTCGCWPPD